MSTSSSPIHPPPQENRHETNDIAAGRRVRRRSPRRRRVRRRRRRWRDGRHGGGACRERYPDGSCRDRGHDRPGRDVGDDRDDPALTPGVINGALDQGAHLIAGMIGTPNNLAVRDTLNEECVPHLEAASGDPAFGEVADYPWTMGSNLPYDREWKMYAEDVAREFPDGATAAL